MCHVRKQDRMNGRITKFLFNKKKYLSALINIKSVTTLVLRLFYCSCQNVNPETCRLLIHISSPKRGKAPKMKYDCKHSESKINFRFDLC